MIMYKISMKKYHDWNQSRTEGTILRALFSFCVVVALLSTSIPASATDLGPFRGTISGKVVGVPVDAANPFLYSVYLVGFGRTNLGKTALWTRHFTDAQTGSITRGFAVLSLPNGEIFGTYVGNETSTDNPEVVAVTGAVTFTGGTGSFLNVARNANFSAMLNITSVTKRGIVLEDFVLSLDGILANRHH